MRYKLLYILTLAGLILLLYASLGNGLVGEPLEWMGWRYRLFEGICHQLPQRTLQIGGVPMAVNARCAGIFSGLLAGWMLIPLWIVTIRGPRFRNVPQLLLAGALLLNTADYLVGFFQVWNSSNFCRFFLGLAMGLFTASVMTDLFRKTSMNQNPFDATIKSGSLR